MKPSARSLLASCVVALTLVTVAACGTLTAGSPAAAPMATPTTRPTATPVTVTVTSVHITTHIATKTMTATPTTPATTPPPSTPSPTSAPQASETSRTAPQGSAQDIAIRSEAAQAFLVVQEYWTDLFVSWDVVWVPPTLFNEDGFYDSALWPSAGLGPYCTEPAPAVNAFYCRSLGYVAFDMQLFRQFASLGDAFIYVVAAHETAHAAQARFIADGQGPAVLAEFELQADCIGGATLAGAEKAGNLVLEIGDRTEMVNTLISLGDAAPGEGHGTSAQRLASFERGYQGDIESCLGNR